MNIFLLVKNKWHETGTYTYTFWPYLFHVGYNITIKLFFRQTNCKANQYTQTVKENACYFKNINIK